jgi:4-amino-4-deoxy-L-arabinose transferase-like glycosyltransferase
MHLSGVQKAEGISPQIPVLSQDSHEYADLAQSLINTHSFVENGKEETFRVPGYPLFVAVFYEIGGYFLVTLIQIILVFLSAFFVREIGKHFWNAKVGELAAVIFLLNPVVLVLSLVILTDVLFMFLFLLGFYVVIQLPQEKFYQKVFLISIIFVAAMYVRPMGVFALPIFIAPFLLSKLSIKNKIKSIAIVVVIVTLALSPWIYRNYKLTGVADFSAFKAMNLACCAVSEYIANKNGTTPAQEMTNIANGSGVSQADWRNLQFSPQLSAYTENIIFSQPVSYGIFHVTASLPFLFSSSIDEAIYEYKSAMDIPFTSGTGAIHYLISGQYTLFLKGITADIPKMLERLVLVCIYLVAVFGFWKERKHLIVWICAFIPLYLMILSGPAANVRYAVQATPFILLLFSVGLYRLKSIH